MTGIQDLYVFDGGSVLLSHNGSIGDSHTPGTLNTSTLHIQYEGAISMESYHIDTGFTIVTQNTTVSINLEIVFILFYIIIQWLDDARINHTIVWAVANIMQWPLQNWYWLLKVDKCIYALVIVLSDNFYWQSSNLKA